MPDERRESLDVTRGCLLAAALSLVAVAVIVAVVLVVT